MVIKVILIICNWSWVDYIFTMRYVPEKCKDKSKQIVLTFIDLQQACAKLSLWQGSCSGKHELGQRFVTIMKMVQEMNREIMC